MSKATPKQVWWTATEIAAARLPGMPTGQLAVSKMATRLNWRSQPDFARCRKGRGGGWQYHWSLFPAGAKSYLSAAITQEQVEISTRQLRDAWNAAPVLSRQIFMMGIATGASDVLPLRAEGEGE